MVRPKALNVQELPSEHVRHGPLADKCEINSTRAPCGTGGSGVRGDTGIVVVFHFQGRRTNREFRATLVCLHLTFTPQRMMYVEVANKYLLPPHTFRRQTIRVKHCVAVVDVVEAKGPTEVCKLEGCDQATELGAHYCGQIGWRDTFC